MILTHSRHASTMLFQKKVWKYFTYTLIEERLNKWSRAAHEAYFRRPISWHKIEDELHIDLPPLPSGFTPFVELSGYPLDDSAKTRLLIGVCEALTHLHIHDFYMGFLLPELIYFHPDTLEIIIDLQPYPSGLPFVNFLLDDYPFIHFSRFTRTHDMSRISDFYAVGLLIQYTFTNSLPHKPGEVNANLPDAIRDLCEKLAHSPESFLFIEEVADSLRAMIHEPIPLRPELVNTSAKWLHPMDPPISRDNQDALRSFLRSHEHRLIGLVCEDESTRYQVISQHFNEVLEHHFFFTIMCRNLPFATLRELIHRTITTAMVYLPDSVNKLRSLSRKFDVLLKQHHEGPEIVRSLTDWLVVFFREILPMFQLQSFYYYFEGCENFDEDSQRVFLLFWETYGSQIPGLHAVFSGCLPPKLIPELNITPIEIGGVGQDVYRRLIISQLGRAEGALVNQLTTWMMEHELEHRHCSAILEDLIENGDIYLTRQGWRKAESFHLDMEALSPQKCFDKRIAQLSEFELEMLRVFACLPMPIRAKTLYITNNLDVNELSTLLSRFSKLGLMEVLYEDSVFVTRDVATQVLHDLPGSEQQIYYRKALPLQQKYISNSYPPLIELARMAGDDRLEYFFLIKYYRQLRTMLSLDQRKAILENIRQLQHKLARLQILSWDRLLYQIYMRLNLYSEAENLAFHLYDRTHKEADRFRWMQILLFRNRLNLPNVRQELLDFVTDPANDINDKIRAGFLLSYVDFFIPLQREGAEKVHHFYIHEFYPKRQMFSTRVFAEFTMCYAILLFTYFHERDEWATVLLAKLESVLEKSPHYDLLLELYNSYIFNNNNRISHKYNQRCLETSRRYGFKTKEQVSHLNGMEIGLFQGDLPSYRYHLERFPHVGEIKRTDLSEQFYMHQLLYAIEWEDWDSYYKLEEIVLASGLTTSTLYQWEMHIRYSAFRRHKQLPPPPTWKEENASSLFVGALYAIEEGDYEKACHQFQESIISSGFRLQSGWSYREMIELLLQMEAPETGYWLEQFELYLKQYGYDVFWPDYFRLSAYWAMKKGDSQRSLLFLRRAINGYQMIEKENWMRQLTHDLNHVVKPTMIDDESPLLAHEPVRQLVAEREQLLHQSLDLLIIIQMSELVTETLDLDTTFQRLTHALFEYFPVTHVLINYELFYRKEKVYFSSSGHIDNHELLRYQSRNKNEVNYTFPLYQQGQQSITMDVHVQDLEPTKLQHMEHFLSFIKPHIANALLYMEMMIDNLTGFYQRRYFLDRLQQELELSKRYGLDLSLIMLDIDNFRLVNEFGHQEGDKVIRELSDIVRTILRKNDIPGRYGGEEFLLILPKTDGFSAVRLAEELRQTIEEEFSHGRPYKVTVSVGVSSLEKCHADTIDELIRLADDAEIAAKTTGKNKVITAW
ncbi:GGDEF domain-containing protein [Brevibacillus dissolubilis]|uniref:GGDEF domain-containing protein n=1 Tax=Brevibacillus dissolubilis TaxID=1844116 RepID=UPI00159BC065|nr:GGDEF domain-containing protein [Brevibacillus dissolubilis]